MTWGSVRQIRLTTREHELTTLCYSGLVRGASTYLPDEYTCRGKFSFWRHFHARLGRTGVCPVGATLRTVARLVLVAAVICHSGYGCSRIAQLWIFHCFSHFAGFREHGAASNWVEHSPRSVSRRFDSRI